ncbi:MAG: hypothetical protein J0I40_10435, partial [Cellulomonas sp.]|nr:hypothetical protein [Cellulomonas sp.]
MGLGDGAGPHGDRRPRRGAASRDPLTLSDHALRLELVGQQPDERLELHVGRGAALLRLEPVQRPRGQRRLAVDELGDLGVDGLRGDDAPRGDGVALADPVDPVDVLDDGLRAVILEWAWTHDELQQAVLQGFRVKADQAEVAKSRFFEIVRCWMLGESFVEIGQRLQIDMDDLLAL